MRSPGLFLAFQRTVLIGWEEPEQEMVMGVLMSPDSDSVVLSKKRGASERGWKKERMSVG